MRHDATINPIFARHETFHPRFGWLKKGFDKAINDNSVFSKESAPVILGVGKNMVKAIKYWCIAFKVVTESKNTGKFVHNPTEFAIRLLAEDGWDPLTMPRIVLFLRVASDFDFSDERIFPSSWNISALNPETSKYFTENRSGFLTSNSKCSGPRTGMKVPSR